MHTGSAAWPFGYTKHLRKLKTPSFSRRVTEKTMHRLVCSDKAPDRVFRIHTMDNGTHLVLSILPTLLSPVEFKLFATLEPEMNCAGVSL